MARASSAIDFAGGSDANVARACWKSAATDSPRATCSIAASFAMYADRLPGFGWLLSHCGAPLPPCCLNRLEHPPEIARIVAGARHDLRAEEIRLLLVLAAVLQQPRAEAELAALRDQLAPPAADDRASDGAGELSELEALRLRRVGGAVAQEHVTQLVRHDADDLAFARRRFEHAAIDEHRAARQCECVDVLQVDRRERVLEHRVVEIRGRGRDEALAQPIEVGAESAVSSMSGYCLRTSAAASRPSCTSCSGVNLFLGGVIFVCAERSAPRATITRTESQKSLTACRPHRR